MPDRITRTIQIALPGGRTSAESVAHIIDTLFARGLDTGERIESITGNLGNIGETFTLSVVVSAPAEVAEQEQMRRMTVEDERR